VSCCVNSGRGLAQNIASEKVKIVKPSAKSESNLQAGFTLAEMIIVVTIILVVGGMSLPTLSRTIDSARLKGAAQTLAAIYQDARIRAAQNNTSYEILVSAPGIRPTRVCIDLDGDGACGAGDPTTTFPAQVSLNNLGVPVQLDSTLLHYPTTNTENASPATGLAWNARGMPCTQDSASSPCSVTGWVQHLQLQRANGDVLYAAVTATPTGRVKAWTFIPSGNGNGKWF
jgi:prepilin-type N-terminal cleavage/methylation domain-containing protein